MAGDIAFPNGMAVTADNALLIVADSYRHNLVAFDIADDGSLSGRRIWADLGDAAPDGICVDAENAVWYAEVPGKRCVRVAEGGEELRTVPLDRGGFACTLGGPDRSTLLITAAEWRGMTDAQMVTPGSGQVLAVNVDVPGAGCHATVAAGGPGMSSDGCDVVHRRDADRNDHQHRADAEIHHPVLEEYRRELPQRRKSAW